MIELLDLRSKILDTQAMIARLRSMVADHPNEEALLENLQTLRKRQANLEEVFLETASKNELDVCSYRFPAEERITLGGVAGALSNFQNLFTVVYESLRKGPKKRARIDAETFAETSFGFGYAFAGSVGFVFTLPNERLLIGETALDDAIRTVFEMVKAESSEEIATYAKKLGVAPIRAMYKWANEHAEYGLSADIEWRRADKVRASVLVQNQELIRLRTTIDRTSEDVVEELTVPGILVGADVKRRTFHLTVEGGADISGPISEGVDAPDFVTLPRPYTARVRKTTRIYYSTEKEEISYLLTGLTEPP
jgi:hypothetical protein